MQPCKTGDQPCSDASPNGECSLPNPIKITLSVILRCAGFKQHDWLFNIVTNRSSPGSGLGYLIHNQLSLTRLGDLWKVLVHKFTYKRSQNILCHFQLF